MIVVLQPLKGMRIGSLGQFSLDVKEQIADAIGTGEQEKEKALEQKNAVKSGDFCEKLSNKYKIKASKRGFLLFK